MCVLYVYIHIYWRRQWHPTPVLAWKIPWAEEPGRLQSIGSLRVRSDWTTSLSLFTFMQWKRKWQPTPVFLPGESQGRGSLVGCRLWGRTESDTTEATYQQQHTYIHTHFTRIYTHNGILISHAKKILSLSRTWMDLEGTLLREVPGRVRQMSYNLTYMWNLKTKTKMNLCIQRTE